ncbi:penicillin acylase family protein [Microlunatus sp. Gsoil 973]|uniref:penicillin acylase family protein n=1 Tax=Microlunatus sp. Gsoil 973 TaxID=2672569 RepID=UPI0018A8675F|nr:penicillin acylase family protein [Microlunatus sp. Gsoil 973]
MRRVHRWVLFVIFVLVLIVGALSSLAVTTIRSSYPQTSGRISLPGLDAEVRVVRNAYGVADIYASDADDLFAAQGYVHAQDRFWEMDFRRHITAGRLSELFGPSQLPTDEVIRTLGWRRVAEQEVDRLSPTTRGYLDSYADGVNAYLRTHKASAISLEYNILGLTGLDYQPEQWTTVDSVSWLKAMAWDLSANKDQEIERALLTPTYGADQVAELFPEHDVDQARPIVAQGSVKGGTFRPDAAAGSARPAPVTGSRSVNASRALRQTADRIAAIPQLVGDGGADLGVGSNSWAVSGSRTTTGKALLSNDPHLATSIPSVFEQMGLHCTRVGPSCPFDVSGYTFCGMPGVIIGHNQQISWGLTTSYVDVEDLYLEQVRRDAVRVGKGWQPLTVGTEEIRVKGQSSPHRITIRESRHGPLLSDVDDQLARVGKAGGTSYAVSLAWTALTPDRTMDAIFALDRATDFRQFRAAAALLAAPSQNLLYADRSGNIGYQLPGAIPIRGRGDGSVPAPGWDKRYDWRGMIKFDQLPYSYNPPSGYIVAANQPIVRPDYPYPLADGESYGWRSQELINRITAAGKISPDTAESFFYDDRVPYAAALLPSMLKVRITDPWVAQGQQVLRSWNQRSGTDSAGAAFFNVVVRDLLQKTFDDQLPEALQPSAGDTWYAVLAQLMKKPNDPWWDDIRTKDVKETRDDIVTSAMYQARKDITALQSRDTSGWSWGRLHRITLKHQAFGDVGLIDRLFNRGDYPAPGGPAVVDALSFDDREGFAVTNGPAMRMLINWADVDDSRWINQSGNSGHAYARTYDDQLPLWATNQTLPFRYTRAAVLEDSTSTLILTPTS